MLLQILPSCGRFNPSLGAEGIGIREECRVLVNKIGGTAHWSLRHNVRQTKQTEMRRDVIKAFNRLLLVE
jgi:hypothetical protein